MTCAGGRGAKKSIFFAHYRRKASWFWEIFCQTYGHISSEFTHKCARDKVIWDMINTLFLATVAVEPTFVALLSHHANISKHTSMASRAILSNFFDEQ